MKERDPHFIRTVGSEFAYDIGDRVTKIKGSAWTGRVVGCYRTSLTPIGYAIESENEPGSVQIYPQDALTFVGESDGEC